MKFILTRAVLGLLILATSIIWVPVMFLVALGCATMSLIKPDDNQEPIGRRPIPPPLPVTFPIFGHDI